MGSMLLVCSVYDFWKKQIPMVVLCIFGAGAVGFQVRYETHSLWDIIAGAMVGGALYIISMISREKIGKGDALMIMSSGVYLGFWKNIALLWLGSALAAVVCLVLYSCMKWGKDAEVPFAPFLLGAYLVLYLLGE